MSGQELRRATKEHAAAAQVYMDAGNAVCATMGRVAALIANESGDPAFYTDIFYKADQAAKLVDRAFHAVRNALEPE